MGNDQRPQASAWTFWANPPWEGRRAHCFHRWLLQRFDTGCFILLRPGCPLDPKQWSLGICGGIGSRTPVDTEICGCLNALCKTSHSLPATCAHFPVSFQPF